MKATRSMQGDFHDVNKHHLEAVNRMLNGDFSEEGAGAVASAKGSTQEVLEMATTKSADSKKQANLADWQDKVPKPVQEAADTYSEALTAKGKALGKLNQANENLIDLMKKHKVAKVRVNHNGNPKVIELEDLQKVKIRKPKENPNAGDDDGEDEDDEK